MVSILPPKRNAFSGIAEAMSEFGRNAPQLLEERYQTQRGLGAIDQLQKDLEASGGDPAKMLPALMRAQTLNKQMERSNLGAKALEMAGLGQFGPALGDVSNNPPPMGSPQPQTSTGAPDQNIIEPISQETQQQQPETAKERLSPKDIQGISNQYLGEVRPDLINPATQYGAINTFNGALKQDLSSEEESRLRQQLMEKYKNPNTVNQVIDRLRQDVKNRYNEALSKYGFDQNRLTQIQKKWDDFTKGTNERLEPHLSKFGGDFPKTKEILQNKYNQYAGDLSPDMTAQQMHTNSMALLQKDIDKLDALHAGTSMPPAHTEGGVKNYLESNKRQYKDLVDQGFLDAVKEDALINKDMGNEEFHSQIWGDQTSKPFLNSLHEIKAPKEFIHIPYSTSNKYNKNYPQEHEKYISDLSNKLRNIGPNDDLVLSRAMVLDSGGDIKDFNQALTEAEKKGLKLSEFQRSQLQEINIPRVPPMWELFSKNLEVSPLGALGSLNWKPFINYLRGKK